MQNTRKPTSDLPVLPLITRYMCKAGSRFIVAPNAFPLLMIPSVVVVRLDRRS